MFLYSIMPLQKKKKKKTAYKKTGSVTQIVNVNVASKPEKKKRKKRGSGSGGGVNPMGGLRGQSTTFALSAPPPQIIYTPEATTRSVAGLIDPPQRAQLTQGEDLFGRKPALTRAPSNYNSRASSLAGSMYSIDTALSTSGQELLRSTSGQSALHAPRGVDVKKAPYPLDIPLQTGTQATQELHPKETVRIKLNPEQRARSRAIQEAQARRKLAEGGSSVMEPIGEGI